MPFCVNGLTALHHNPNNEFWHSLQWTGRADRKVHEKKSRSLVSALACFSSSLECRELFCFISNTCISSKHSTAQFSNDFLLLSLVLHKFAMKWNLFLYSHYDLVYGYFPLFSVVFSYWCFLCTVAFLGMSCLEKHKLTSIYIRILYCLLTVISCTAVR